MTKRTENMKMKSKIYSRFEAVLQLVYIYSPTTRFEKMNLLLEEYAEVKRSVNPIMTDLLAYRIDMLDAVLLKGTYVTTWNSLLLVCDLFSWEGVLLLSPSMLIRNYPNYPESPSERSYDVSSQFFRVSISRKLKRR